MLIDPSVDQSHRSFKASGRNGTNAGPGQAIDTDCLQEGKQYQLTAQIKITNENDGDFTCDKYTEWLDPNYCPLFTLIVMTPDGEAKLNLGNDMITVLEWIEGEWNPYFTLFSVDERLASASTAYLVIRGPRAGINIYFDDVAIVEHLGIDTRNNAWSAAPSPEGTTDDQCIASTSHDSQSATPNDLLVSNFNYQYYSDSETYNNALECAVLNGDAEVRLDIVYCIYDIFCRVEIEKNVAHNKFLFSPYKTAI